MWCREAVLTSSRRVFIFTNPHIFFNDQLVSITSLAVSGVSPLLFLHMSASIWSRKGWIGGSGLPSLRDILVRMGTSNDAFAAQPDTFSEVSGSLMLSPSLSRPLMSSHESHSWASPSQSNSSSGRVFCLIFLFLDAAAMGWFRSFSKLALQKCCGLKCVDCAGYKVWMLHDPHQPLSFFIWYAPIPSGSCYIWSLKKYSFDFNWSPSNAFHHQMDLTGPVPGHWGARLCGAIALTVKTTGHIATEWWMVWSILM